MRMLAMLILGASAVTLSAQERDMKAYFQQTCAACHGPDGTGKSSTGSKLPGRNLTDAKWQAKQTDSGLEKSILNGKDGMPGFKGQLNEAEVQRLIQQVIRPLAARKK